MLSRNVVVLLCLLLCLLSCPAPVAEVLVFDGGIFPSTVIVEVDSIHTWSLIINLM